MYQSLHKSQFSHLSFVLDKYDTQTLQQCEVFVSLVMFSHTSPSDSFQTKVSKGKEEKAFYSIPEYDEWKNSTENAKSWKVKYYKGLGTSTPKEAKEYFADMKRHEIQFHHEGPACDQAILMVCTSKLITDELKVAP